MVELQRLVATQGETVMRMVSIVAGLGLLGMSVPALAQANPGPSSGGPLGTSRGVSNNPGSGDGDMPGSTVGLRTDRAAAGVLKGAYGLDLTNRIASAQKLVDEVARGRALTDRDTRQIRNLMREDFIAWNKQFDLLPSAYRAERDRWLVDPNALTAKDWSQQRLKWLQAQRDWILAHDD